eukprot:124622-Prymnesium_polylepis.4
MLPAPVTTSAPPLAALQPIIEQLMSSAVAPPPTLIAPPLCSAECEVAAKRRPVTVVEQPRMRVSPVMIR